MTTPDQPPSTAEIASWMQADAIVLRNAFQAIRNRWPFVQSLPETTLPAEQRQMYSTLAELAQLYYGERTAEQLSPLGASYDVVLYPARRGG
jgi:hypothetical protein